MGMAERETLMEFIGNRIWEVSERARGTRWDAEGFGDEVMRGWGSREERERRENIRLHIEGARQLAELGIAERARRSRLRTKRLVQMLVDEDGNGVK